MFVTAVSESVVEIYKAKVLNRSKIRLFALGIITKHAWRPPNAKFVVLRPWKPEISAILPISLPRGAGMVGEAAGEEGCALIGLGAEIWDIHRVSGM